MSTNGQRRSWNPAEKPRIVPAGMQPGVEVSDLCRRERLNPVQFHAWKKHLLGAEASIDRIVGGYKEKRLHSSLGYLPPVEFYRGDPATRFEELRGKLFQARHQRRERNLEFRKWTLPLEGREVVSAG